MGCCRVYVVSLLVDNIFSTKRRIELQQLSGIQELNNVTKLKPILIAEILLSAALLLPIGIADWILGENFITGLLYNLIAVLMLLSIIVLSGVYGIKLMKIMRRIYKSTKINRFKVFFKKVELNLVMTRQITYYLFAFNIALSLSILVLVAYTALGAQSRKWFAF